MERSELLEILEIMERLMEGDVTSADLQGVQSRATFHRRLAEARHLGARIVSVRRSGGHWYRLENAAELVAAGIVARWLEIERRRSVV